MHQPEEVEVEIDEDQGHANDLVILVKGDKENEGTNDDNRQVYCYAYGLAEKQKQERRNERIRRWTRETRRPENEYEEEHEDEEPDQDPENACLKPLGWNLQGRELGKTHFMGAPHFAAREEHVPFENFPCLSNSCDVMQQVMGPLNVINKSYPPFLCADCKTIELQRRRDRQLRAVRLQQLNAEAEAARRRVIGGPRGEAARDDAPN